MSSLLSLPSIICLSVLKFGGKRIIVFEPTSLLGVCRDILTEAVDGCSFRRDWTHVDWAFFPNFLDLVGEASILLQSSTRHGVMGVSAISVCSAPVEGDHFFNSIGKLVFEEASWIWFASALIHLAISNETAIIVFPLDEWFIADWKVFSTLEQIICKPSISELTK